jgi:prephenate dehydratase
MIHVSFQGERGAYSEDAARSFFKEEIETVPFATFAEVLESTSRDKTDYAILPVENSLEGSVGESYDLLYSTPLNNTSKYNGGNISQNRTLFNWNR